MVDKEVMIALAHTHTASHRELQELRSAHADTISELDKTRRLLSLQHTINGSYKKEVRCFIFMGENHVLVHNMLVC